MPFAHIELEGSLARLGPLTVTGTDIAYPLLTDDRVVPRFT